LINAADIAYEIALYVVAAAGERCCTSRDALTALADVGYKRSETVRVCPDVLELVAEILNGGGEAAGADQNPQLLDVGRVALQMTIGGAAQIFG
jgi:hypothetical protein